MTTLQTNTAKALGLCSGGLDSILAGLVLKRQNIHVEWVSFETPFFSADKARKAARSANIPLTVKNITEEYLPMLKNPPCGYGKHMNPCMDCHALMFSLAGRMMTERGFDFIFSGEVSGQRPMSQTTSSLRYVEKRSGFDGRILRPLSARILPETLMEREGIVNREELCDFSGRSRKPQIALAEQLGVRDYPAPAGGCLLTEKVFSAKLRDLLEHLQTVSETDLHLLRHGRHMRLGPDVKIVTGRTKQDNENILKLVRRERDVVLKTTSFPGASVLMPGGGDPDSIALAAKINVRYSKAPAGQKTEVEVQTPRGVYSLEVSGLPPDETGQYLIGG